MNHKNAAGRNWARQARHSRAVNLGTVQRAQITERTPSSVWYTLRELKDVPGRNWTREPRKRRLVHLQQEGGSVAPKYPLRELGGGDHDQAYKYHQPSWRWTFPFTERQYARLLALRSRVRDDQARFTRETTPAVAARAGEAA